MDFIKKNIILVIAALLLALPFFMSSYHQMRLLTTLGIYLIITMGLNLLLGYTGLVSIGQAGIYGIAGYTSGLLMVKAGFGFWTAALVTLLVGAVAGLLIGVITLKLNHAYLAIVTLGMALMVQTVALNWRSLTGGFEGLQPIPKPELFGYVIRNQTYLLFGVLAIDIAVYLLLRNLLRSKFGRSLRAVRDDSIAASMMGINVRNIRLMSFTISSVLASLAGALYAGIYGGLFPDYFSMDLSVLFLCMVVLGGMGTQAGPIIGAVFITYGLEWLSFLGEGQMLVYGILIVTVCVLKPAGIFGLFEDFGIVRGVRSWLAARDEKEEQTNV